MDRKLFPARPLRRGALLTLALGMMLCPARTGAQAEGAAGDADTTLRYEIRPGDDPGRIARTFRVPVEELLRRNGIHDASRMKVGSVLEIPDPRATVVQELRARQDLLASALADLRRALGDEQARAARLDAERSESAAERDALAARLGFYRVGTVVGAVASCAVLGLALALVVILARLRDEAARRTATVKHAESLRATVDRYRSLGAQLELKYQALYRQASQDAATRAAAEDLRAAYDDERAALEKELVQSAEALAAAAKPKGRRRKQDEAA